MSNDFTWMRESLDRIVEKQSEMNMTLAENTISLKEHIRRTELLETELKPIKAHVDFMNKFARVAVAVGGIIGMLHSIGVI